MKENPEAKLEDAICYVEGILEKTKMKLLEHALMDGNNEKEMPKPFKMLHLGALKVFQMFFNSANIFDSKDSLRNDINKAIFVPFEHHHTSFQPSKSPTPNSRPYKKMLSVNTSFYKMSLKCHGMRSIIRTFRGTRVPFAVSSGSHCDQMKMKVPSTLNFSFAH